MDILQKHDLKLDNQGICEIDHILDYICDKCKNRWGEEINGQKIRATCQHCRFMKKQINYESN